MSRARSSPPRGRARAPQGALGTLAFFLTTSALGCAPGSRPDDAAAPDAAVACGEFTDLMLYKLIADGPHPAASFCLARDLSSQAHCFLQDSLEPGRRCDEVPGRTAVLRPDGTPAFETDGDGSMRLLCRVAEAARATDADAATDVQGRAGWFYDPAPTDGLCTWAIAYTSDARPLPGTITSVVCCQ